MTITINGHGFSTEIERLCRLFYPDETIRFTESGEEHDTLHAQVILSGGEIYAYLQNGGEILEHRREISPERLADKTLLSLSITDSLYGLLCRMTEYTPPWGMLSGVRPIKLMRMLHETGGEECARRRFLDELHCSREKYELALDTMRHEQPILEQSDERSFSLYISIPFCPTRCSYCSFVSQSVEKTQKLIPEYVGLLIKEIEATAQTARSLGLRLETVYMGGGTPTTLSAQQMTDVLAAVSRSFDMSAVREFTVEAGRPDTVTPEKLAAIRSAGVRRISINPQTMIDPVLQNIGRRHTVAQVYEAMDMARAAGFDSINMDMIAGLPGDTAESFGYSLGEILSLHPENITVHTLSMKRASHLVTGMAEQPIAKPDGDIRAIGDMLRQCSEKLPANGYHPYYLYRQTRMLGNMENVGWAKPGHDGLYNVYIMDETHTILAVGAGAVTKLRQPGAVNIERIYNYKFPYEYISRFETIIERKKEVTEFYEKFC